MDPEKPKRRRKIVVNVIIAILLLLVVLVFIVPIPVSREYAALEVKLDDPSYIAQRTVIVSGYYHFNLFSDDQFTGKITIPDYEWTQQDLETVQFMKDGCPLIYYNYDDKDGNGGLVKTEYFFGEIYSGLLFRNMCIAVFSENTNDLNAENPSGGSWHSADGICIVPAVSTRQEALDVLKSNDVIS